MVNTFQRTSATPYLAPGVVGGWASANPDVSLLQPNFGDLTDPTSGSWRVGAGGALIGNFAFADVVTGLVSNVNPGTGALFTEGASGTPGRIRVGFVQRDQIALITPYLGGDTLAVPVGVGITLHTRGDFWAKFAAGAAVGSFVFASYADGSPVAGNTSTPPTATGVTVSMNNSVNLTAVAGGTLVPGQPISGAGIPAGAFVVSVAGNTAVISAATTGGAASGVAITQTTAAPTNYRVDSLAAAGDIAKISVWG